MIKVKRVNIILVLQGITVENIELQLINENKIGFIGKNWSVIFSPIRKWVAQYNIW